MTMDFTQTQATEHTIVKWATVLSIFFQKEKTVYHRREKCNFNESITD